MKKHLLVALSFYLPPLALSASPGIEATNYLVNGAYSSSDAEDELSLSGQLRIPVADYTGFTLSAELDESDRADNYVDTSGKHLGIGLFLRRYDLGSIGLQYLYRHASFDDDFFTDTSWDTNSIGFYGTYYIDRFDLHLTRWKSKSRMSGAGNSTSTANSSVLGIAYYLTDNLRAGVYIGGMDAKDWNSIHASYQPAMFDNAIEITASYDEQEENAFNTYSLSLSYFFDTKVNLIDRIRRY